MSGRPSKFYEELLQNGRLGFLSMPSAKGMLEGGKAIIYEGQILVQLVFQVFNLLKMLKLLNTLLMFF